MITLFCFSPFLFFTLLACLVGAFLADNFNWGGGNW